MTFATILTLLQSVIQYVPGAITTGQQLYDLANKFFATVKGRDPTDAEKAALRTMVDVDVATALEPLPPPQPGDPDYVAPTHPTPSP